MASLLKIKFVLPVFLIGIVWINNLSITKRVFIKIFVKRLVSKVALCYVIKIVRAFLTLIGSLSSLQLWECFFDEEILSIIVTKTNAYAGLKNVHGFITCDTEIKSFLGILYLTGYHTLPTIRSYWWNQSTQECQFVNDAMRFERNNWLRQIIRLNNNNPDKNDKFAKITALNTALNNSLKFMQFSIFSHSLSVDEQMIAYYDRHCLKMYKTGKPIRFGYKYWALASVTGYCYSFIPYAGASANNKADYELGENVVLWLLEDIADPSKYNVSFDNFFTSHSLLCTLSRKDYFAISTVRDNRSNAWCIVGYHWVHLNSFICSMRWSAESSGQWFGDFVEILWFWI